MHKRAIHPSLVTIAEAAAYLGASRATVWRLIAAGRLSKCQLVPRPGSRVFVRYEDLNRLVEESTTSARGPAK